MVASLPPSASLDSSPTGRGWFLVAEIQDAFGFMPHRQGRGASTFLPGKVSKWRRRWPGVAASGTKFEAPFAMAHDAFQAIIVVSDDMFPTRLAFGLGFGADENRSGNGSAASARHQAAAAVQHSVKREAWVTVRGAGEEWDDAWSAGFRVVGVLRRRWTRRQLQVIQLVRAVQSQKEAAKRLRCGTGSVSTVLKTAHWSDVRAWEQSAAHQFLAFDRRHTGPTVTPAALEEAMLTPFAPTNGHAPTP